MAEWLWRVTQDLILSVGNNWCILIGKPAGVRIPFCSIYPFALLSCLSMPCSPGTVSAFLGRTPAKYLIFRIAKRRFFWPNFIFCGKKVDSLSHRREGLARPLYFTDNRTFSERKADKFMAAWKRIVFLERINSCIGFLVVDEVAPTDMLSATATELFKKKNHPSI